VINCGAIVEHFAFADITFSDGKSSLAVEVGAFELMFTQAADSEHYIGGFLTIFTLLKYLGNAGKKLSTAPFNLLDWAVISKDFKR